MSISVPVPVPVPAAGERRATTVARWVAGGALVAAALAVLAIVLWPASEADKARADGEDFGAAVASLYDARSVDEVAGARADMQTAIDETRDDAGDAVAAQAERQRDALARAADGFTGALTAADEWSADLYEAELDTAVGDLGTQAGDFRDQGSDVEQAFWDGYRDGLTGA
jgi:hypothetical protein